MTYEFALNRLLSQLTDLAKSEYDRLFPNLAPAVYSAMSGKRFDRIVVENGDGTHRRVWGFIEKRTGDIYKAASWSQPAKHTRGTIFANDPLENADIYGPKYLR